MSPEVVRISHELHDLDQAGNDTSYWEEGVPQRKGSHAWRIEARRQMLLFHVREQSYPWKAAVIETRDTASGPELLPEPEDLHDWELGFGIDFKAELLVDELVQRTLVICSLLKTTL